MLLADVKMRSPGKSLILTFVKKLIILTFVKKLVFRKDTTSGLFFNGQEISVVSGLIPVD